MKQKIHAYFAQHRQQIIEDVKTLVRIPSDKGEAAPGAPFGPGPNAALQCFLQLARERGFDGKNYDGYVGTVDLNLLPPQLDILAHLDVVPVADNWTVCAPFDPVEQDGKLYGRGTSDDKGPAVIALWAMKCIRELGVPLARNTRLIVGTDEECGSGDIEYYYKLEQPAPMTVSPDAEYPVINIEKGAFHGHITASFAPAVSQSPLPRLARFHSGLKVNVVPDTARALVEGLSAQEVQPLCAALAERTGLQFIPEETPQGLSIRCIGVGAHAASPHMGNNALTGLLALIAALPLADCDSSQKLRALSSLFPHGDYSGLACGVAMEDAESGPLTLSLNLLEITPEGLDATFDSRLPLCATEANMKDVVTAACASQGLSVEDLPMRPPHHVPADSPLVQTLLGIYRAYTGLDGEPLAIGGGTYVHELENGVAFGCVLPGTDTNMHGADEFAVIDELILSAEMYAQLIVDLCGE